MQQGEDREHILIVEDDAPIRKFMASALTSGGYEVSEAESGKQAFARLRNQVHDLVLLDLKLEDVDGMEILRTIRRQDEEMPVIIVSSMQDLDTKVGGFEIGCDDYVTKPFHVAELLGRVRRLLRRTSRVTSNEGDSGRRVIEDRIAVGRFTLDLRAFKAFKGEEEIQMRKKIFDLFLHFARHPDTVISKETLHRQAWDAREDINENSLYVHIHKLRSLIEDDPSHPRYLKTVRGMGFTFTPGG